MHKVAFIIYGFKIYWYGIMYALSVFLFVFLFVRQLQSLTTKRNIEMFLVKLLIYNVFFARIFHCFFYDFNYFALHPVEVLNLKAGGLSFFGGVFGIGLCVYLHKKILCKINNATIFFIISDAASSSSHGSIFLMRIANFMNKELLGKEILSKSKLIGHDFGDGIMRHPSQIYEACLEGIVPFLLILIIKSQKNIKPGIITALFLISYGIGRFICEFFKEYDLIFLNMNINQIFSFITVFLGVYIAASRYKFT